MTPSKQQIHNIQELRPDNPSNNPYKKSKPDQNVESSNTTKEQAAAIIQSTFRTTFAIRELKTLRTKESCKKIPLLPIPTSLGPVKPEKFGSKYTKLQEIDSLLKKMPGISVPTHHGISHEEVHAFLSQMVPELFKTWKSLEGRYQEYAKNPGLAPFLQQQSVARDLHAIQEAIRSCFSTLASAESPLFKECATWVKKRDGYLMVRSTSNEDGDKGSVDCVNAGGNESPSYIPPERAAVFHAVGEVVASYFSTSSLKNRLQASKASPFKSVPQLSVFLQDLIGEPIGGASSKEEIPISLVLFSNEPDYTEKGMRIATISATWGHGEAVVNSAQVATDTILAINSSTQKEQLSIIYSTQAKPTRLAPLRNHSSENIHLQAVQNPPDIRRSRCLNERMIQRLVELGDCMEKGQGYPVDMEFVIKKDMIYVVQIRPIIRLKANNPTYLASKSKEGLHAEVLVPGPRCVQILPRSEEILTSTTLKEAEAAFNREMHRIVIVTGKEPKNSHPIVNFRGMGIPCFQHSDLRAVRDLVERSTKGTPLLACSQSGKLLLSKQTTYKKLIKKGYFFHPAPIAISLGPLTHTPPPFFPAKQPEMRAKIEQMIRALKEADTSNAALKALTQLQELPALDALKRDVKGTQTQLSQAQGGRELAQKLHMRVTKTFKELRACYEAPSPRLRKLFHIKTLSILLTAEKTDTLHTLSLAQIPALRAATDKLLAYEREFKFAPKLSDLLYVGEHAFSPKQEKNWTSFLQMQEKATQEEQDMLRSLIRKLEKCGALSFWLCKRFSKPIEAEAISALTHEITPKEEKILARLELEAEKIEQTKRMISLFGNPKTFPKAWEFLKERMEFFSSQEEFVKPVLSCSEVPKITAIQLMKLYVEVADSAIKAMKASPQFNDAEKLQHLQTMLASNREVLRTWAFHLVPKESLKLEDDWGLKKYFSYSKILQESFGTDASKQLSPSPGFSVAAASLASRANYERHQPKTLEDLFTRIHQDQLFIVSTLNRLSMPQDEELGLSSLTQQAIQQLEAVWISGVSPFRFGSDLSRESVALHYNICLRNHSAMITLEEHKGTNTLTFEVKMLGQSNAFSITNRWPTLADYLQAVDHAGTLSLEKPVHFNGQELSFQWRVETAEKLPWYIQDLNVFLEFSMNGNLRTRSRLAKRRGALERMGEWFYQNPGEQCWRADFLKAYIEAPLSDKEREKLKAYGNTDSVSQIEQELDFLKTHISVLSEVGAPKSFVKIATNILPRFIKKDVAPKKIIGTLEKLVEASDFDEEVLALVNSYATKLLGSKKTEDLLAGLSLFEKFDEAFPDEFLDSVKEAIEKIASHCDKDPYHSISSYSCGVAILIKRGQPEQGLALLKKCCSREKHLFLYLENVVKALVKQKYYQLLLDATQDDPKIQDLCAEMIKQAQANDREKERASPS